MKYNGNLYSLYCYILKFGEVSLDEADLFIYFMESTLTKLKGTPSCDLIEFTYQNGVAKSIEEYRNEVFDIYFSIENENINLKKLNFNVVELDWSEPHSIYGDTSKMQRNLIKDKLDLLADKERYEYLQEYLKNETEFLISDSKFSFLDVLRHSKDVDLYEFYAERHELAKVLSKYVIQ